MPKFKVNISLDSYETTVEAKDAQEAQSKAEDLYIAYLEGVSTKEIISIAEII